MDITHKSLAFWNALEKKSKFCVPNHIKNLLHYAGFASSRLLKNVDEKVISETENFARDQLFDLIEARCQRENTILSHTDKQHFFGEFASDPGQFYFSDDEKTLIMSIASCAKQLFESNDIDSVFEQMNLHDDTISLGWYFKDDHKPKVSLEKPKADIHEHSMGIIVKKEEPVQIPPKTQTHHVLGKLLSIADRNAETTKPGYRYDPEVKKWAAYMRMLSGPIAYNTLQRNLNIGLPSISRINHFVQNTHNTIVEGVLRSDELLVYLKEKNSPHIVALSEDATNIVDRVEFNSKKNQLTGFVLPIDRDGMPVPFVYGARNTDEIVGHFAKESPVAKSVITVMAQPISDAPPFPLLIFGTDSKFDAEDVSRRWKFIANKLNALGIEVLTMSSDSDPKYNSGMRRNSLLGRKSKLFFGAPWFKCGDRNRFPFYVQDYIHLCTKLRNFLLKTLMDLNMLPLGDYYVQIAHLQYIVDNIPKDQHEITQSVLNPTDRQNFDSVLRICNQKVFDLLKTHVEGSEGTVQYLKITKNFLDAYMDYSLEPLERIDKLWYSLIFVRIWREFVLEHESLTLKDNFLTSNTYSCMEQNAHSMVLILLSLKQNNQSHLFKPWLFCSQPCEDFYRQLRAFSPSYSTVTNFTVKGVMDRVHQIELQNEISSDPTTSFMFQVRKLSHSTAINSFELPTEKEIFDQINKSRDQAIKDATKMGLIGKKHRNMSFDCKIAPYSSRKKKSNEDETFVDTVTSKERVFESSLEILHELKNVTLKNFADKFKDVEQVDEMSPYTEIFGGKKRIIIKKNSLIWLLRNPEKKLSSDRLQRVKTHQYEPKKDTKDKKKNHTSAKKPAVKKNH